VDREGVVELIEEGKDPLKDVVCGSIFTPKIPPAFDNSFVVAVYLKVSARTSNPWDCPDEEFKANGLGPSDVSMSVQSLPTWDEAPGSPSVLDGDGNPEARACIGEGVEVEEDKGSWDRSRERVS
jgi:hypothetical protein